MNENMYRGNSGKILWTTDHVYRNACFKHANVQSKAVFSFAMTTMDETYGWEDEEKRVGSKFAACMWIYTKEVLTRGPIPTLEMEQCLKRRTTSIMLCMKWVCVGTFDDHEWVSESTVAQHVEEVMGMELDFCQKSVLRVWYNGVCYGFSAPIRLNRTLEKQDFQIKKYHEAVNMAITYAISRPFGGEHTPRSCMLTSVAGVLLKTRRKWRVHKEMEGWVLRGSLELLPFVDDDDSDECSDE